MAQAHTAGTRGAGFVVRAVGLATWITLCDLWLKAMARVGACEGGPALSEAIVQPWRLDARCHGVPMFGDAWEQTVHLLPAARTGGPFDLLAPALEGVSGQLWGLALLALATAVTIVVVRWRWRDRGDALALGVLWGGCLALALPRLVGDGSGLTEMTVAAIPTGVGDLALCVAALWLGWRAIAEALA